MWGTERVLTATATWTFLCDCTIAFQVTYLTNVLHKLDPLPAFALLYSHKCSLSCPLTPFSLSFSFSPPFVFLFWRSFQCRSKSNIWVSLYVEEQDLQDIVGRMCELEQFTLWESPTHRHTSTYTHANACTQSDKQASALIVCCHLPRWTLFPGATTHARYFYEYSRSMRDLHFN